MHRISRRMVAVVVLIGAIAAGGAAFTASNTIPDTVAGYGTSNITGATANSLTYTFDGPGTHITGAHIVFTTDVSADTVKAGFGTDSLTTCTPTSGQPTQVDCAGFTQDTSSAGTFNVLVTNTN